jgi:hypothetical protein
MMDILLKLRKLGAIMSEVPLILRYDLKFGIGKMRVMNTSRPVGIELGAWRSR